MLIAPKVKKSSECQKRMFTDFPLQLSEEYTNNNNSFLSYNNKIKNMLYLPYFCLICRISFIRRNIYLI